MYSNGWHKSMAYLPFICCSSPLNPQVLLYDGHASHFCYRELNIFWSHHIQYFILKSGDYVHDHTNDNSPNFELKNVFGNTIINFLRNHRTLKFSPSHMNDVLVETWEYLKLSSATIAQEYLNKTHLIPL